MQSAFLFENGRRIIFETRETTTIVYYCDSDWSKTQELSHFGPMSPEEDYHLVLRESYLPQYFIQEQSTIIAQ
jgi:hypothetical protein